MKISLLEWWPACLVAWSPQSRYCLHWWEQDPSSAGWWLADQFHHAGTCQGSWLGGQPIRGVGQWPNWLNYPGDQRSLYQSYQVHGLPGADRRNTQLQWGTSHPSSRRWACFCQEGAYYSRNPDIPRIRIVNCMKESEMEKAPHEWENVCLGYEVHNQLYSHWANVEPNELFPTNTGQDPMDLDKLVKLAKPVVVPAFSSAIVKGLTAETIITGHHLHIMTQAPYLEDKANLPIRLYVLCNYCKMKDSSRSVYLVLRNGTSQPIHLSGAARRMSGHGESGT